jgi:7-cyano-7-deazaguanine synthase in queuosine biosynthesis
MMHHSLVCRLGAADTAEIPHLRPNSRVTEISFIGAAGLLRFGLRDAFEQLRALGLRPTETAADLALFAAVLTAADTRIARDTNAQDGWTRRIDLHVPVTSPDLWTAQAGLITDTLEFLTGDRWSVHFRNRLPGFDFVAAPPAMEKAIAPSSVCLFSGGLDSFIGAIDLLSKGESPLLISHYWDAVTSIHQTRCAAALRLRFPTVPLSQLRARIGFPSDLIEANSVENTLRARSFLFFSLATLAASGLGKDVLVHVPENGLISLNVPLDPLRLGASSTRTTHPHYMARYNDLLQRLGISARLENRYRHKTKGTMARECAEPEFLRAEAKNTMSCSGPSKHRYAKDKAMRVMQHCGHCVPCLIRRAALTEGLGTDDTPYAIPDLRARVLDTTKAEGETIRSFQLALARVNSKPGRARFDIHRPGPLRDCVGELAQYEAVYVNGLREVGRLLEGVKAKPL